VAAVAIGLEKIVIARIRVAERLIQFLFAKAWILIEQTSREAKYAEN
jgi:hypothetical protein